MVKMNEDLDHQNWYIMYKKNKDDLKGTNENIVTSMIWGSFWDRTMKWLIECYNTDSTTGKSKADVMTDSGTWGNYKNNSITYTNSSGTSTQTTASESTRIPSGSSETTKANNIYDLAGNIREWTIETSSTNRRMLRQGRLLH